MKKDGPKPSGIRVPKELRFEALKNFKSKISKFMFARVEGVIPKSNVTRIRSELQEDLTVKESRLDPSDYTNLNIERKKREVYLKCDNYEAYTEFIYLSDNAKKPKRIYLLPSKISIPDIYTFEMKRGKQDFVPEKDNLVCFIAFDNKKKKKCYASHWFVCSQQFERMCAYVKHKHMTKKGITDFRRFAFSGNRLCTNNFEKWKLASIQNKIEIEYSEAKIRYFFLRCEPISKKWIHIYAAIVLMFRYGEFPHPGNRPINLNFDPSILKWNIPENFCFDFIKNFVSEDLLETVDWEEVEKETQTMESDTREGYLIKELVKVDIPGDSDLSSDTLEESKTENNVTFSIDSSGNWFDSDDTDDESDFYEKNPKPIFDD